MKRKIYRSTLQAVLCALLIFSIVLSFGLYLLFADNYRDELKSELNLLCAAMNGAGDADAMFALLQAKSGDARLTLIDTDGTVLADSEADSATMDNHLNRPEVAAALKSGEGSTSRVSGTLGKMTFYYARTLADGRVLRLSGQQQSVFGVLANTLGLLLLAIPIAMLAVMLISERMTKAILRPVNNIDLDRPTENDIYDEFTPLLAKLAMQNRRIDSQVHELKRRQKEFTAITENMSEGLLILNAKAEILMMNRSARQIFQVGDADCTGQYALSLHRTQELLHVLSEAELGRAANETLRVGSRTFQLIASPVFENDAVSGILLLIPDITERYEAEQTRREFSANVSHELKTPLTAILGYAELMKNGFVPEKDIPQFSGQIYDAAQRLLRLVEDIIHLSRLDENSAPVEFERADLAALADSAVCELQAAADDAGIRLSLTAQSAVIECAPSMISELLINLIGNAIKYNRADGSVTVEVAPEPDGGATLTVKDTGIGIAPEHHEKIFERFYRVDKSHSREVDGTGLGLSIVKHIAAFHSAKIELDSAVAAGTTISIRFPAGR